MKKNISLLIAVIMVLTFTSCGGGSEASGTGSSNENITVVFVPKLTGNAFFESANDGAQEYAAKYGFSVKYNGSPEATSVNQAAIISEAIKDESVKAICVSSVDQTALDDVMKQAMAAGKAVTTWDSDVSGDARSVMVSQGTPEILGEMLVEMGVKSLVERGLNPDSDVINYVWHYSQEAVADQNSWRVAGEAYIKSKYSNWNNVNTGNYYSEQDADKSVSVGEAILNEHPDIDLIICNDSTALPGQCKAAQNLGFTKNDVTITGFAPPNSIKSYCTAGIIQRWGLWDCKIQGALGCYLAYYLASGNTIKVGDKIDVPDIGTVEVLPNTVLTPTAYISDDSGVVLLPARAEFTIENMDDYNF